MTATKHGKRINHSPDRSLIINAVATRRLKSLTCDRAGEQATYHVAETIQNSRDTTHAAVGKICRGITAFEHVWVISGIRSDIQKATKRLEYAEDSAENVSSPVFAWFCILM